MLHFDIEYELKTARVTAFDDVTQISDSVVDETVAEALQKDLILLYKWADAKHTRFNSSKCELIRHSANDGLNKRICDRSYDGIPS